MKRYTQMCGAIAESFDTFTGKPSGEWVKFSDLSELSYELMGVVADVEQGNGFDDVCLQTIKRVIARLSGK